MITLEYDPNVGIPSWCFTGYEYTKYINLKPVENNNNGLYVLNPFARVNANLTNKDIIVDGCWEADHEYNGNFVLEFKGSFPNKAHKFFWYHEYFSFTRSEYHRLNLDYLPRCGKKFLLPIAKHKDHRYFLLKQLGNRLEQAIYSAVYNGKYLPGEDTLQGHDWQRRVDPTWFSDTLYSIVAESEIYPYKSNKEFKKTYNCFITEKTYKCFAFKHPFVCLSTPGTHEYIKNELGFEVFDNIFNLDFDNIEFNQNILEKDTVLQKINLLVKALDNINYDEFHSKETQQKIEYNYNRFYNKQLVYQGIEQDFIQPLRELCD